MGNDFGKVRVGGMFVAVPVGGGDMDFDIAGDDAFFGADLQGCVEEVGTCFVVPASRVDDGDFFAIAIFQVGGAETIVGPNALEVAFGIWKEG